MSANITTRRNTVIQDPPIARFLFSDTRMAWFWLVVRLWLGWQWVDAGWHKVTDPKWVQTGESLLSYWQRAVAIPAPPARPAISFDWYRSFLQFLIDTNSHTWFGPMIAWGELLVGIGLIVGAFVGIAAFFGAVMNWSFIMAGSASTNGFLLILAIGLILAWKIAGYIGADYFLLRWLGTPWPGLALRREGENAPLGTPAR
jgi:thiosulfate dehydrogenase (quinone) large subunit